MTEIDLAPLRKILMEAANQSYKETEKIFSRLKKYGHLPNLVTFSYYYQAVCTPYDPRDDHAVQNALRLIGLASLIEAMMHQLPGRKPYLTFLQWWKKEECDLRFKDYSVIEDGYLRQHGASKQFVNFVSSYFCDEDKETLESQIVYRGQNGDTQLTEQALKIEQIAKLLYQIRSEFVHAGQMPIFRFGNNFTVLTLVQGKIYDFRLSIIDLMRMFERAFAKYVIQLSSTQ